MAWPQTYDPLHQRVLSTLVAALPVVVLLGGIALLRLRAHVAALLGLAAGLVVAIGVYRMPVSAAAAAAAFGAGYGLFPIGWIVLNIMFLYRLTVDKGWFAMLRRNLGRIAPDRRVQVILIAFSFGSFFEGAAGFGTPVAITSALLIQLGFAPLEAAGLSLIANTAPVAFGALGTPLIALSGVTGLDLRLLSAMTGRELAIFSVLVPFWVVCAMSGWRGMLGVWREALAAGLSFGIVQLLVAEYHGPWLVDILASIASMLSVIAVTRLRRKNDVMPDARADDLQREGPPAVMAWIPWIILTVVLFVWGLPAVKSGLDGFLKYSVAMPRLHNLVLRVPPVVPRPTAEPALLLLNFLSATGTGILFAALVSGFIMGFSLPRLIGAYFKTIWVIRYSLLTIAAMLGVGYLTRYAGLDATMGLALAKTGHFYPFFGTLLGWLGVALSGSDTSSNVLFGSLQRITAAQVGVNPVLMAAANSSGGVMGKMIDAQSIVVASTATESYGNEGPILRFVFFHSVALAVLMGLLVFAQANTALFGRMVVHG
jgi:lactate permease